MPRARVILKYVPAVLCGLLAFLWGVSARVVVANSVRTNTGMVTFGLGGGNIFLYWYYCDPRSLGGRDLEWKIVETHEILGEMAFGLEEESFGSIRNIEVPFAIPLMLLVPISVCCTTRFRFPLWSWFAWTALVAAELVCYLRA